MTTTELSQTEGPASGVKRKSRRATLLIDGDVHPSYNVQQMAPWLEPDVLARVREFGLHAHGVPYPRVRNGAMRLDSRPEEGHELEMVQRQLLNEYEENIGILIPMAGHHWGAERADVAIPLCHAINEFICKEWLDPEPRFFSTLNVPMEHPEAAVQEIERYKNDKRFVQILMSGTAESEIGDKKYWPIYEAAEDAGLALGVHEGANSRQRMGVGYPSYYLDEHVGMHYTLSSLALSMICEGVFEAFPKLQVVSIEASISWAASLQWEMDSAFEMLGRELPHLHAKPSEYFREHFWFTTQPIEEPDDPNDLVVAYELTGMLDRIMFSSDYPHWDFDSPSRALPATLPTDVRDAILGGNACRLYGLDPVTAKRR
jgi:uncharacterized protein